MANTNRVSVPIENYLNHKELIVEGDDFWHETNYRAGSAAQSAVLHSVSGCAVKLNPKKRKIDNCQSAILHSSVLFVS